MQHIDDLAIINAVIPHAANGPHRSIRLIDPLLDIAESGLDSMDVAVLGAYLGELFDVPVDLQRDIPVQTVQAMFDYLRQHGRRLIKTAQEVEDMLVL